jgi:hypothetical protein
MIDRSSKWLWIGLVFSVILGALWQLYPMPDASERMRELPFRGTGYIGQDIPLTDFEEAFFKNVGMVKRVYQVNHQNYFLTALDGTKNRHAVHDPYYCFRGGGWEIIKDQNFPLPDGEAKLVEITKGAKRKTALYWFSDGTSQFTSPWRYWWDTTARRLTLGRSGEEPLLVILQPLDDTTDVDWPNVIKTLHPVLRL